MKYYQQGDVLIKEVKTIPNNSKKKNDKTLAIGEATGHHHTITEGEAELYEHEGTLFLKVNSETATLTHQEHKTIEIPQGEYEIGIVREYSHFDEEVRNVKD